MFLIQVDDKELYQNGNILEHADQSEIEISILILFQILCQTGKKIEREIKEKMIYNRLP